MHSTPAVKERDTARPCCCCRRPTWSIVQVCVRCRVTSQHGAIAAGAPAHIESFRLAMDVEPPPPIEASKSLAVLCFWGGGIAFVTCLVAVMTGSSNGLLIPGASIVTAWPTLGAAIAFRFTPRIAKESSGALYAITFLSGILTTVAVAAAVYFTVTYAPSTIEFQLVIAALPPILGLAIVLTAVRIFGKGRHRVRAPGLCWQCGYQLRGLSLDVCPECGVDTTARRLPEDISE